MAGTSNHTTGQVAREPHGTVGARDGRRAIAQANTTEIVDALCRYSAPEEVSPSPKSTGIKKKEKS